MFTSTFQREPCPTQQGISQPFKNWCKRVSGMLSFKYMQYWNPNSNLWHSNNPDIHESLFDNDPEAVSDLGAPWVLISHINYHWTELWLQKLYKQRQNFFFLRIYLLLEIEWVGGRQRQRIFKQIPLWVWSPRRGSISPSVRSWPQPKPGVSHLKDWNTQAPCLLPFYLEEIKNFAYR